MSEKRSPALKSMKIYDSVPLKMPCTL